MQQPGTSQLEKNAPPPSPNAAAAAAATTTSSTSWSASDFPSMSPNIDAFLADAVATVAQAKSHENNNICSTDYTVTNFKATKEDRMWAMKESGEMIDAILITADGHREPVHLDMLLLMEKKMTPFFTQIKSQSADSPLPEYVVDPSITTATLQQIVFFAYYQYCHVSSLTVTGALELANTAAKFNVHSLAVRVLEYLVAHCSVESALKIYELVVEFSAKGAGGGGGGGGGGEDASVSCKKYLATVETFVQDHFEKIWTVNQAGVISLKVGNLATILAWDKLDVKSEQLVWSVIEQWTEGNVEDRRQHLPGLLTKCLRFGRLPETFTRETILGGRLVSSLSASKRRLLANHVKAILKEERKEKTMVDGHHLPYSLADVQYRPRETKHYLLCVGGWVEGRVSDSVELYDYQRQLWLASPFRLPHPATYCGLQLLDDGCLYLFGGHSGAGITKALRVLHLKGPLVWKNKCSMIERRCYPASVVLEDGRSIVVMGGYNGQRRVRSCERYDRHLDMWTELASMNIARSDASAVLHGGRIFVAGGINDSAVENSVEVYCPRNNHWRLVNAMLSPRTSFALIEFGARLWALGGNDGTVRLNTCESFDPVEESWHEEASFGKGGGGRRRSHGRSTFRAFVLNGELYIAGGFNGENPVKTVEKYVNGAWHTVSTLLHERSGHSLLSLPHTLSLHFTA